MGWREFKAGVKRVSTRIGKAEIRFLDESDGPVRVIRGGPLPLFENIPNTLRVIPKGIRLSTPVIATEGDVRRLSVKERAELLSQLPSESSNSAAAGARETVERWRESGTR